jgi:hypothetical protein
VTVAPWETSKRSASLALPFRTPTAGAMNPGSRTRPDSRPGRPR